MPTSEVSYSSQPAIDDEGRQATQHHRTCNAEPDRYLLHHARFFLLNGRFALKESYALHVSLLSSLYLLRKNYMAEGKHAAHFES